MRRRIDDAQKLTLDLMHFHRVHQYDAFANPGVVGLGRCRCGVNMYYSEHDRHFAEALQEEFVVTQPTDGKVSAVQN